MKNDYIITFADYSDKNFTFKTLDEVTKFVTDEIIFWTEKRDNYKINHNFLNSIQNFNLILKTIENAKENNNIELRNIDSLLSSIKQELRTRWIWSGHPYTHIFLDLYKKYGDKSADFFIKYVAKNEFRSINNQFEFAGAIQGYNYLSKDESVLQRKESEELSFNILRDRLNSETNSLFNFTNDLKDNYESFNRHTKDKFENLMSSFEDNFSNKMKKDQEFLDKQYSKFAENIHTLEQTYQEKLRLQKPAQYWETAANKYSSQGMKFFVLLVLSIIFGLIMFYYIFIGWLNGKEIGIQFNTVQGVIIFATLLTCFAFYIKTLSKLVFSSFHLMRDAEEREQLVYLYLSLTNENNVEESSRNIILQSLFSRTDTGLLSRDSGPTMPSVTELIRMCGKN